VSSRQLQELAQDAETEARALRDSPALVQSAGNLLAAATHFAGVFAFESGRRMLALFLERAGVARVLEEVREALAELSGGYPRWQSAAQGLLLAPRARPTWRKGSSACSIWKTHAGEWIEPQGRGGALLAAPLQPAEQFQNCSPHTRKLDSHLGDIGGGR